MGCVVNGPGEAREADIGLAGGRGKGIIFRKGEVVRAVDGEAALLAAFMEELDALLRSLNENERWGSGNHKGLSPLWFPFPQCRYLLFPVKSASYRPGCRWPG